MNPLASRKQLLVAESNLNRARLAEEWRMMAGEIHALAGKARTVGRLASTATLVASLSCFRRNKAVSATGNPSWFQTILKGAGLVRLLWSLFQPRVRDLEGK
jgi:hypothetical protein